MIANIFDAREAHLRWRHIWGVAEPTFNDNVYEDADPAPTDAHPIAVAHGPCSLPELLAWANGLQGHVTLFLYCEDPMTGATPLHQVHRAQPTAEEMRLLAAETLRIAEDLELHARSSTHTSLVTPTQQNGAT